jgi:hypothetical protein
MSRRVRRGPVKLNEEDEVIPVCREEQRQQQEDSGGNLGGEHAEEGVSPPRTDSPRHSPRRFDPPPPANANSWGAWLSGLATKTAQGLDKLYELANQPVPLRGEHVDTEEDRKAAAASLNDLIRRVKHEGQSPGDTESAEAEETESTESAARLTSPQQQPEKPEKQNQQEQRQSYLSRLGKTTIGIYSRARDHWQQQLASVDDAVDRSVDDAFKLYGGMASVDLLQKKGQASDRAVRSKLRSMTPRQSKAFGEKLKGIEESFDSERLLESVVYIEESDTGGLTSSVPLGFHVSWKTSSATRIFWSL